MPVEIMIFLLIFDRYSCKKLSVKSADATLIASILSELKILHSQHHKVLI